MKKLNLICSSIAIMCASVASAGTLTPAGTVFATQNFGATFPATGANSFVVPGTVTYSLTSITAVNAGATVYFTVRLTGAKFAGLPATSAFSFAGKAPGTDIGARNVSADGTTLEVAVTASTSVNIGLGAFSYTPQATDISSAGATLATVGGKIDVSIGLTTSAAANAAALDSANPLSTLDLPLPSATLATSASAITGSVTPLPATGSGVKIDLTTVPPGADFTLGNTGLASLGTVKFTNVTGTQAVATTLGADYTVASSNGGFTVTVTPGAGQAFPVGTVLALHTGLVCSAPDLNTTGSGTVAFTAGNASAAKVLTTTTVITSGQEFSVCLSDPTGTNVATPITVGLTAATVPANAASAPVVASGTGYALEYNGANVDVLTYWPGGLDAFSYKGYLRVTNTGTVTANVSFAHVNKDTGALSPSVVIIANLAPGQSKLISSVAIDAVAGVAPSNLESGRARITAPTNGLRVQSLLQTGNSAPIEYRANTGN
ncbi:MAG: hypothetical protein H7274_13585 [Rhodoferax sp.]|nr:hypothetical protein [Rhodoferax sp.]